MQIEVPTTKVIEKLALQVANLSAEKARLEATNEVLIERLREYEQRGRSQALSAGQVDDQSQTG
jgi:hypothetical protein